MKQRKVGRRVTQTSYSSLGNLIYLLHFLGLDKEYKVNSLDCNYDAYIDRNRKRKR